jgi:hypothetical protein
LLPSAIWESDRIFFKPGHMNIRAKLLNKKFDVKKTRFGGSCISPEVSHSYAPADRLLDLQRTIGNRELGRLFRRPAAIRLGRGQDVIQLTPEASCVMGTDESKMKTEKGKDAPKGFYGADFNHIFPSLPDGCSLRGFEATEVVDTVRDDFRSGVKYAPAGKTIWTLTKENRLAKPDSIWTAAGPKGIGVNPLLHWPAVQEQNQLWYYRRSKSDSWHSGPGIVLKVTLSGDIKNRSSLNVRTTDHDKHRDEPYRGPTIRIQ